MSTQLFPCWLSPESRLKTYAPRTIAIATFAALLIGGSGAVGSGARRVAGHIPKALMAKSTHVGRHSSGDKIGLAVSLNVHDQAGLSDLIKGLSDPSDPRYHQFLTPAEFRQRFAPSDAEVATLADSLRARGLTMVKVHENNLLLEMEGSTRTVEQALQVELHDYRTNDGRVAFAPSTEPLLQGEGANLVVAVNGLSTLARRTTHAHKLASNSVTPHIGPDLNRMTPAKIRTAYNLNSVASTGTGETIALMELDGYTTSDITTYAAQFSISPMPTLQNVYVTYGGSTPSGAAGSDTDEVVLDIEVAMALAPGLSKIMVYESANSDAAMIANFNKIATDNLATVVSTSWGLPESGTTSGSLTSEYNVFQQMATQGQSIFAASGDSGAYDDGSTLSVDDPASQPYVTGVGGTTLTSNSTTGVYGSETTWASGSSGGGGGISSKWSQPTWQAGVGSTANGAGTSTQRLVPDVSLDADPNTGYPVYVRGAWYVYGGTSAAAPLWAAFTAIVNQGRVAAGSARIGFMNSVLYPLGTGAAATTLFHDVADNSTNRYYKAVAGYDMATGLGTINGLPLYTALVGPAPPSTVSVASAATAITVSWSAVTGASSYSLYRASTSGGAYSVISSGSSARTYVDGASATSKFYYVTTTISGTEGSGSGIKQSPPTPPSTLTGAVQ